MLNFDAASADDLWRQAARALRSTGVRQDSRIGPTKEILHATATIRDPRQRLVFARPMNPAFAIAEVIWIVNGRDDTAFVKAWNPRMAKYSDNGIALHGAYGKRLRAHFGVDQVLSAFRALEAHPESRQVVLQFWDASRDLPQPSPRAADIPCNLTSHLMIREGRLEWLQVMRSNDVVWGLPYNIPQFTTMQEIMAGWLDVEVGSYNHVSDSLHAYEHHWPELDLADRGGAAPVNTADLRLPYAEWMVVWAEVTRCAEALTRATASEAIESICDSFEGSVGYREWIELLAAERLRVAGDELAANAHARRAGGFWGISWNSWAAHKRAASESGHAEAIRGSESG